MKLQFHDVIEQGGVIINLHARKLHKPISERDPPPQSTRLPLIHYSVSAPSLLDRYHLTHVRRQTTLFTSRIPRIVAQLLPHQRRNKLFESKRITLCTSVTVSHASSPLVILENPHTHTHTHTYTCVLSTLATNTFCFKRASTRRRRG